MTDGQHKILLLALIAFVIWWFFFRRDALSQSDISPDGYVPFNDPRRIALDPSLNGGSASLGRPTCRQAAPTGPSASNNGFYQRTVSVGPVFGTGTGGY